MIDVHVPLLLCMLHIYLLDEFVFSGHNFLKNFYLFLLPFVLGVKRDLYFCFLCKLTFQHFAFLLESVAASGESGSHNL